MEIPHPNHLGHLDRFSLESRGFEDLLFIAVTENRGMWDSHSQIESL